MIKVVLQKDLYLRSYDVFSAAAGKYGIDFKIADVLDENAMIGYQKEGVSCYVLGAEAYSRNFYNSLNPGSAVIRYGVGYNAVPVELCRQRNIKVAYTPGTLSDSVAEHTFAMLLALNRNIPRLDASMKKNQWQGITGMELKGKTIAVLGYGQIGRQVAKIARSGFGMKVHAYDIFPQSKDDTADYYSTDYESVVRDADIITIHMAVTRETCRFFNAERISHCKNGSVFINISRGDLVDEKALFDALVSGKISKAAIDVFVKEPYQPEDNADFRCLDNVILTPHCGSNTREASERMAEMVVQNILAYAGNREMILIPELKDMHS